MQAHGRFAQEAWRYDRATLDSYRDSCFSTSASCRTSAPPAATAARCGLPIIRPLLLSTRRTALGWQVADAYGFGPSLWVAPVVDEGARERRTYSRAASWIDFWTGERVRRRKRSRRERRCDRIPVWVRARLARRHPPGRRRRRRPRRTRGDKRPLEATLWGEPVCGRAKAVLADGSEIRWQAGAWDGLRGRHVEFSKR